MKIYISLEAISDNQHRYELRDVSYDDWHLAQANDTPNDSFRQIIECLADTFDVLVYTTMPESYRLQVEDWLIDSGIQCDELLMRPEGDFSKNYQIALDLIDDRDKIAMVVDNDVRVLEILRDDGVFCLEAG